MPAKPDLFRPCLKENAKAVADREKGRKSPDASQTADALDAQARIDVSTDGMMMRGDNSTLINVGAGVTFGAFGFNVACVTLRCPRKIGQVVRVYSAV